MLNRWSELKGQVEELFVGLTDLLKAADRRLGRERLERELAASATPGVGLILGARAG